MRSFEDRSNSMFRNFGIFTVFTTIISFASIGGLIYFTLWCLKHFGIIGG